MSFDEEGGESEDPFFSKIFGRVGRRGGRDAVGGRGGGGGGGDREGELEGDFVVKGRRRRGGGGGGGEGSGGGVVNFFEFEGGGGDWDGNGAFFVFFCMSFVVMGGGGSMGEGDEDEDVSEDVVRDTAFLGNDEVFFSDLKKAGKIRRKELDKRIDLKRWNNRHKKNSNPIFPPSLTFPSSWSFFGHRNGPQNTLSTIN